MVYFTCNNCGDSLPKPKVSKHYQTACSRQPINLTCCDCHKDFRENEYETHTKCITEQEKYSDKNFVAKPNKGEEKQAAWVEAVQSLINETHDIKPVVRRILDKLAAYDNVPRKKAKFLNFIRNSNGKNISDDILEEVWSLLEEKLKNLGNKKNDLSKHEASESNGTKQEQDDNATDIKPSEEHIKTDEVKMNGKSRGKEEEKQTPMTEVIQSVINKNEDVKPSIKAILNKLALHNNIPRSKKKLLKLIRNVHGKDTSDEILEEIWTLLEEKLKIANNNKPNGAVKENGKPSDKTEMNGANNGQLDEGHHVMNGNNVDKNKKKRKMENNECGTDVLPKVQKLSTIDQVSQFAWQEEIMNVLKSNDNEINIKKLRKKLIECYTSFIDFDKLFMKKLNKIKGVVVHDELVKLANK